MSHSSRSPQLELLGAGTNQKTTTKALQAAETFFRALEFLMSIMGKFPYLARQF
jgi:hypothetical protein